MKKAGDVLRMIRLFIRLVYEMLRHYFSLNNDLENNFMICKKICRRVVSSARIQLQIQDYENLGQSEPFLLVSNHRCFFDVVFLLASVERPIRFVAAKELLSYPILRKYLNAIQCVTLDRNTKKLSKIKKGVTDMKSALATGNLVLFPEGECSYYDKRMKKFKKGGFMGVFELGTRIVPTFIYIDKIQNIGRWMIPRGEVRILIGEGFYPDEIPAGRNMSGELAVYSQQKVLELQEMAERTGADSPTANRRDTVDELTS